MTETIADNEYQDCVTHNHQVGRTLSIMCKPPILKTIVPVIFIPGIFGSRLENPGGEGEKGKFVWDPNQMMTLIGYYAKSASSMFAERYWSDKEIEKKARRMHGSAAVMNDLKYGEEDVNASVINHIVESATFKRLRQQYDQKTMTNNKWDGPITYSDLAKKVAQEEYDRRSARGWYGVWNSYPIPNSSTPCMLLATIGATTSMRRLINWPTESKKCRR
jgi:hypothetical protein